MLFSRLTISACTTLPATCCAQRAAAEKLLLQLQEHPQAWQRVDVILASAQNQSTKYFALQG
jgi:exportin-1